LVTVGRILRSHDKWGEVKLRVFELENLDLARVERVFVGREGRGNEFRVESVRPAGHDFILKLKGVDSLSQADSLAHLDVMIPESALASLEEGRFYIFELVGCRVISVTGEEIGTVADVVLLGENSLLSVDRCGKEALIPFIESFCKEVNLAAKEIRVDLPAGLLDLNES
jgi:16S rRNA processing protein RimM